MRASRLGSLLLALGLFVGALAALGITVGFRPSQLPAALLDLAAYKLALAASLGLLGAGALFHRYARRGELRRAASSSGPRPFQSSDDVAPPLSSGGAPLANPAFAPLLPTAIRVEPAAPKTREDVT